MGLGFLAPPLHKSNDTPKVGNQNVVVSTTCGFRQDERKITLVEY